MDIAGRTVRGIFWAYATFIGGRLLTLISTAILARLLVPKDFGLIGFALVLLGFIEVMRGFGINEALIYANERIDEAADTAFVLNFFISWLQTIAVFLLAPLSQYVFDDPRIVDIVRVMAFSFFLTGLGQTQDALLQKELEFKRRFFPDLLSTVLKGVASIALALGGAGVWSLVFGHLIGVAARTAAKWYVVRWLPRLRFFPGRARELWGYGVHILAFEILNVALEQADQLLIGVMLGAVQLGYYSVAARIPEMVIANFSIVLTRVIFPAFAKMKDDLSQLTQSFLATTKYTAFVTVPLGVGMAAIAPELVRVVFGEQWGPAVDLLRVLALLGTVATLPWSAGDVLKAIGRPDISTKMLVIEALYTFPLIVIFVYQSRMALMASLANLIALSITAVFRLAVISRFLKLNPLVFLTLFRSSFAGGALMFGAVTLWRMLVVGLPLVLILASSILLGAVVYATVLWVLERDEIMRVWKTLLKSLHQRRSDVPASSSA